MEIVTALLHFVEFLIVSVIALAVLLVVLLVAISMLPKDNPPRQMLVALTKPVGVMVGAGVIGTPIEFIPGIDALYDIAALVFIAYSWIKFARQAGVLWPSVAAYLSTLSSSGGSELSAQQCFARANQAATAKNWPEAVRWYRQAAQKGHAASMDFMKTFNDRGSQSASDPDGQGPRSAGARPDETPRSWGTMTRAEALEILELREGASQEQIAAAYKRIMRNVHPDRGGSTFFAKQLNAARDLLMV
jgi:hypothetical protein